VTNRSSRSYGPDVFTRDRLTFLTYGMATAFGFAVSVMGPAMPSMRDELGMSRTVGGLHFTALAAGSVLSGFIVERIIGAWGRRWVFWTGGVGLAAGAALIGLGWNPGVTLVAALLAGVSGASMLAVAQATLSDHHSAHRSVALTEVNMAMSFGSVIPALLVGATLAMGFGWRPAFVTPLLILLVFGWWLGAEPFPATSTAGASGPRLPLPRPYWFFWAAFIPAVGAEWSLGAWGADYLVDVAGNTKGTAAFLMGAFFGAMVVGRFLGSRVARRVAPLPLLIGTTVLGLSGFLAFWGSVATVPVVIGLLLSGLGISMQFPMILSLALEAAPGRANSAAARLNISSGGAVLVAPLILGAIADQSSIRAAFGIVPALFFILVLLVVLGHRAGLRRRPDGFSEPG
jgi:MFS family permease